MPDRPKPPEGYKSWIDYAINKLANPSATACLCAKCNLSRLEWAQNAIAELADLQRKAAAMDWLATHDAELLIKLIPNGPRAWYIMQADTDLSRIEYYETPWEAVEAAMEVKHGA